MEENTIINEVFEEPNDKQEVCVTKETPKSKNIRIKFLIWILIGVMFIGVIGSGAAFCYSEAANVNKQLEKGNIKNSAEYVEKINPITKFFFKNLMMEKVEKSIEINQYSSYDDGNIIYLEAIKDYEQYKKITEALDLASEENKTIKYINTIIELSKYEKYNSISKCLNEASGDIFSALECLNQANSSYSDYSRSLYYAKGLDHLVSARNKVASESGYMVDALLGGITKLIDGFTARLAETSDLPGDYGNSHNISVGQEEILAIVNSLEEPQNEIDKLINNIKSLE